MSAIHWGVTDPEIKKVFFLITITLVLQFLLRFEEIYTLSSFGYKLFVFEIEAHILALEILTS